MEEFLDEVRNRYDDRFIVLDSTPSQVTAEASVLARHVDGIVFVVMARKSPKPAIEKAIENLGRDKILGVVFNGHSSAHKSYDKYYKKYYGSK
jgi:Mrp family chromosome partitioning ATPase